MRKRIHAALWMLALGCGGDDSGGDSDGAAVAGTTTSPYVVDMYDAAKAFNGTTFFSDIHEPGKSRIVEVDMNGNVVWEYILPSSNGQSVQAADVEYYLDAGGNERILYTRTKSGIYEIDRSGKVLWSYLDPNVSHDADLVYVDQNLDSEPGIEGECVLYGWGMGDAAGDAQAKIVRRSDNKLVWSWRAKEHETELAPTKYVESEGYAHTNAVGMLPNGNIMINLRNFQMTAVVDPTGRVVSKYDWATLYGVCWPHDPEFIPGIPGDPANPPHVLVALQGDSTYQAVEIEWPSGTVVWTYAWSPKSQFMPTRDADRLPNKNTLLQTVMTQDSALVEVTQSGEIVWRLRLTGFDESGSPGFFFKAQRVGL